MKGIWVWAALCAGLLAAPIVVRAQAGGRPPAAQADEGQGEKKDEGQPKPEAGADSAVRTERSDSQRKDAVKDLSDFAIEDAKNLTPQEKQAQMESKISRMREALGRVTELLSEARAAKDVSQRNCVNEKLTQIKGLVRISEDASVKMYDAIAANAQDAADHEFTKVAVAHEKVMVLRTEAEQCVGELSIYTGDTEIDLEIDPDIAANDPTKPIPQPPVPEVPPVASAF